MAVDTKILLATHSDSVQRGQELENELADIARQHALDSANHRAEVARSIAAFLVEIIDDERLQIRSVLETGKPLKMAPERIFAELVRAIEILEREVFWQPASDDAERRIYPGDHTARALLSHLELATITSENESSVTLPDVGDLQITVTRAGGQFMDTGKIHPTPLGENIANEWREFAGIEVTTASPIRGNPVALSCGEAMHDIWQVLNDRFGLPPLEDEEGKEELE